MRQLLQELSHLGLPYLQMRSISSCCLFLSLCGQLILTNADYDCVCNYKVETPVTKNASASGAILGYMYEFDCKPIYGPLQNSFSEIAFEHQVGYVEIGTEVTAQTCQGDPPDGDKITTTTPKLTTVTTTSNPATTSLKPTTASTTTPKPTTTKTQRTTTTTTTTPKPTTTTTTPKPTTTSTTYKPIMTTLKPMPEGHIELCPPTSRNDVEKNHGFLGQYGEFCYEYVPYKTQWKNAERHCNIVSSGHLTYFTRQDEQDYVLRFLKSHNHHDDVWIGLTDADAEGTWKWSSGANLTLTRFQKTYSWHTDKEHKLNDCIVMKSNGEWVDLPCGVQLVVGLGFGESHAYVCQYNLTSKPVGLFNGVLSGFIVG